MDMPAISLLQRTHRHGHPARVARRRIAAVAAPAVLAMLVAGALALAAPGLAFSGRAAGRTVSPKCKGGANSCKAVVSLAGGASREKLKIALTDTDLKLKSVVARPASIRGAYQLSGGRYSLGGSLYTVTLNAVQAIPRGATLTLTFAAPAPGRG
jgi:hypothetical protein